MTARVILPRPRTVARILGADPPDPYRVAIEAAAGVVTTWCRAAPLDEGAVRAALSAMRAALGGDVVDVVAVPLRRAVWATWLDEEDADPEDRGRFSLADGTPALVEEEPRWPDPCVSRPPEDDYWRGYRLGLTCDSEHHEALMGAIGSEDRGRDARGRGYRDGRAVRLEADARG